MDFIRPWLSLSDVSGLALAVILAVVPSCLAVGLFPARAAAHLDANLVGMPPSNPAEWNYYGISAEESKKWIREGIIFAGWAAQWKTEGFSPEAAGKWHQVANVYTAGDFLKNGFGPKEAQEWMRHGIRSGQRAREYLSGGMGPREAGTFWEKKLYPKEAQEWYRAGFDAEAMLEWHFGPREGEFYITKDAPFSRTVYDLKYAVAWKAAGFTAEEAHRAATYRFDLAEAIRWKHAAFSFNDMVIWKDSGFSLEGAVKSRREGLGPREAELREHDRAFSRQDEIAEFEADITLKADGTLDVVETVTLVRRLGSSNGYRKELRARGCRLSNGRTAYQEQGLQVKSVEVDGRRGAYRIAGGDLYCMNQEGFLPEGEHRISIAYSTDRMILHMPQLDELCFVVVGAVAEGNYVRKASAVVRLPKGAHVVYQGGYAGLPHRRDLVSLVEETAAGDTVWYEVTRPLRKNMAFAVDIGIVQGQIRVPYRQMFTMLDRRTNRFLSSALIAAGGIVVTFFYYWIVWFKVGRDPKGLGVSRTEFTPPDDVGPAALRTFLKTGTTDYLSVAAQLVSLAMRGFIRISELEGTYRIEEVRRVLPQSERESDFLAGLFHERRRLTLTGQHGKERLSRATRQLKASLKNEYRKQTARNTRFLLPGIVLSVLFFSASFAIIDRHALFQGGPSGRVLFVYAAFLVAAYGLLSMLFARLLRRPTEDLVHLRERLRVYAGFLKQNFRDQRGFIPPVFQEHLPFAIAAGIDVRGMQVRSGETAWYRGSSGGFECGDFIAAVRRSL